MAKANWPDPPGWDPTPCCGSHALLPLLYPLAVLAVKLAELRCRDFGDGPPWPQG